MFIKPEGYDLVRDKTNGKTMLSDDRLIAIYNIGRHCRELDGDFAELGCCNGGVSFLLSSLIKPSHKLYAFDSFEGLPKPSKEDMESNKEGEFRSNYDEVVKYLSYSKVVVHKGWIEDTLINIKDCTFSLIHIDLDLYASTKFSINFLWDKMVSNGYMIFDDYSFTGYTHGVKKAVDEFFGDLFRYNHYFIHSQLGVMKP
jgi:O-methyltransferase